MKKALIGFFSIFFLLIGMSCGGDDNRDNDEPRLPEDDPTEIPGSSVSGVVKVVSQSIEQDAVIDSENTQSLILTYSGKIAISKPEQITVNDRVVVDAAVDGNVLTIPLTLEPAISYTVVVKSDALLADGNNTVKPFSLSFRTKAVVNLSMVSKHLCNANANEETVELYEYMLSVYGNRIISGVIEDEVNRNCSSDAVFLAVSQRPLIACYDFRQIHTTDYSDISAIKEHYGYGGIVAFAWEWFTPSQENDIPENYSSDSGFSVQRAVNNGTWESKFIEDDIELVAQYLQMLQEEGISVLFCPVCTAQGHWWGQSGAPYFKCLWELIYDRLVVKYKLNNLIWVWSVDVSASPDESIYEWYPGDKFVDVIGIKADFSGSMIDEFLLLNETFGGKKMLAVTECGDIPEPDACVTDGSTWAFFIAENSDNDDVAIRWNRLMSNEYVVTCESK